MQVSHSFLNRSASLGVTSLYEDIVTFKSRSDDLSLTWPATLQCRFSIMPGSLVPEVCFTKDTAQCKVNVNWISAASTST